MDRGEAPGQERHLPDEIKESAHYKASTQWGKSILPGSHASQQRDHPYTRERKSSDIRPKR